MNPDNINDKDLELIERHLDGELTGDESVQFQKRLNEDPEFKRFFDFRQELPELWNTARRRQQIRKELDAKMLQKKGITIRLNYKLAAAASVLLLIGVVLFQNSRDSSEGYYSDTKSKVNVTPPVQAPGYGDSALSSHDQIPVSVSPSPDSGICFKSDEPVQFRWNSENKSGISGITIRESATKTLKYFQKLPAGQHFFTLYPGVLKPGNYEWYPSDDSIPRFFSIVDR
jgi:hypothetical protein